METEWDERSLKMDNNEILAHWQGRDYHDCNPESFHCEGCAEGKEPLPDYLNDDAACMSLLDTLVEKGWEYSLFGTPNRMNKIDFRIYKVDVGISMAIKPTINEAIIAACLEVAREIYNSVATMYGYNPARETIMANIKTKFKLGG